MGWCSLPVHVQIRDTAAASCRMGGSGTLVHIWPQAAGPTWRHPCRAGLTRLLCALHNHPLLHPAARKMRRQVRPQRRAGRGTTLRKCPLPGPVLQKIFLVYSRNRRTEAIVPAPSGTPCLTCAWLLASARGQRQLCPGPAASPPAAPHPSDAASWVEEGSEGRVSRVAAGVPDMGPATRAEQPCQPCAGRAVPEQLGSEFGTAGNVPKGQLPASQLPHPRGALLASCCHAGAKAAEACKRRLLGSCSSSSSSSNNNTSSMRTWRRQRRQLTVWIPPHQRSLPALAPPRPALPGCLPRAAMQSLHAGPAGAPQPPASQPPAPLCIQGRFSQRIC